MSIPVEVVDFYKIVLAIQEVSWLFPVGSKIQLTAGKGYLIDVPYEILLLAIKELEYDYQYIRSEETSLCPENTVVFKITDYSAIDGWGAYLRKNPHVVPGEKKTWGDLTISVERAWLELEGYDRIQINLANKTILFLLALLEASGAIVSYQDLTVATDTSTNYEGVSQNEMKERLKTLKRELCPYLVSQGLPKDGAKHIRSMVQAVKNTGYKLKAL